MASALGTTRCRAQTHYMNYSTRVSVCQIKHLRSVHFPFKKRIIYGDKVITWTIPQTDLVSVRPLTRMIQCWWQDNLIKTATYWIWKMQSQNGGNSYRAAVRFLLPFLKWSTRNLHFQHELSFPMKVKYDFDNGKVVEVSKGIDVMIIDFRREEKSGNRKECATATT